MRRCPSTQESKFKIYIGTLTKVEHRRAQPVPTTDGQLRPHGPETSRDQGNPARNLACVALSAQGEEENIFPFREEADAMFARLIMTGHF